MVAGAAGMRGIHRNSSPGCLPGILRAGRGSRPAGDTAVGKSASSGGNRLGACCVVDKSFNGGGAGHRSRLVR
jgi:hypothetical protein